MKYIIYLRRSSEDKTKQIQSIPDQLEWAKRRAKELGLDVLEVFQDTKTGTKPGREGFNSLMDFIHEYPEPVGILCWKMDRLARNPIDEGMIKYAFMQGKIKHILANDREFREGENQILMGVEFGAATQFSIDLGKNVNRGLQTKIKKGVRPTSVPIGYLNDPNGLKGEKEIFKDHKRWEQIREAWKLLLSGLYTVPQIRKTLNEDMGLRTRKGCKVSLSTLYDTFNNTFYSGIYEWQGEIKTGIHEAMITLDEFDKVQLILGRKGKPRQQSHEHAFTGIIRCAECGYMITEETPKVKKLKKTGKVTIYHYIRCSKKNPNQKCGQKYIRLEELEAQIDRELESIEIPESFAKWAFKQIRKENKKGINNFAHQRAELQRKFNENEQMIDSIVDNLARGTVDDATYKSTRKRYELEGIRLKKQLDKYRGNRNDWLDKIEATFHYATHARANFINGDKQRKREMFVTLGSNFLLKDGELSVELHKPFQSIKESMEKTKALFPSLEPLRNALDMPKKADLDQLIPIWSHLSDSNR